MEAAGQRAHLRLVFGIRRSNVLLFLVTVIYGCYLLLGGLFFVTVEREVLQNAQLESVLEPSQEQVRILKEEWIPQVKMRMRLTEDLLEKIIVTTLKSTSSQQKKELNATKSFVKPYWDLNQAVFFSFTTITTIGYGRMTPQTQEGKLFCIMYSLIGVPLTLLIMTAYVGRLKILSGKLKRFLNERLDYDHHPYVVNFIFLFIIVTILQVLIFYLPATIFMSVEPGWTFMDALYFCFVSLTTIGLGDYIPGEHPQQSFRAFYKACVTVYLAIGLTLMMYFLALVSETPLINIGYHLQPQSDEITSDPEKMSLHVSLGQKYIEKLPKVVTHQVLIIGESEDTRNRPKKPDN